MKEGPKRCSQIGYVYFPLFQENGVDLVLTGHDHHFDAFVVNATSWWNGTIYIVNGGGGAELDSYLIDDGWGD